MNIESIKSYVLAILVLLSLLLTFSLWNYKPNYERSFDRDYVDEINLGGTVKSKAEMIQPESVIFKKKNKHYSFSAPKDNEEFYKEMQTWVLNDFNTVEAKGPPKDDSQVELVFPDAMLLDILPSIFDMNMEEDLPEWSFERIYLTLNNKNSTLKVQIISTDQRYEAQATISNVTKYNYVKNYIDSHKGMSEYISMGEETEPIYIKNSSITLPRLSATIDTTDQLQLVNTLFKDPSTVRRNVIDDETLYTDGQRQMRVYYNRRLMEFVNPYQTYERMPPDTLLEQSITNINEYNGWTDSYILDSIDLINNRIIFQMYYNGYPVFSKSGLATIEQDWHDQEIVRYKRPLFSIKDSLGEEAIELPSGNAVKTFLQGNDDYENDKIDNIKVGYRLSFQDTSFYTLSLDPVWYIQYNGEWQEIVMEESTEKREVS